MAFDNSDFVNLLNFYKENDNFPDNARKSFNKFSEVSKSDNDAGAFKNPLIIDDNCIFDLDNMCWNSHLKNNGSVKSNRPLSVDALHFKNGRLYLIEFKGTFNSTLNSQMYLEDIYLNNNHPEHQNLKEDLDILEEEDVLKYYKKHETQINFLNKKNS